MQPKVKLHRGELPFKPLTEEEKVAKVMQILHQKREAFAVSILVGLCTGDPAAREATLVDKAVEMADGLIKKLYPVEEESE